ncbi:MAG: phosphoglycerate kinase [Deltaproteobacteria bacterium]|nr:phosphoglycerate kinase [Deltaproteobacteria bacterium]MBN2670237.1 phosphoglycerate kinase [Deltaproteobacteria bacterium]
MAKLFVEDLALNGKKVISRVDFNVPIKDGKVDNDKRIRASLPTIQYILDQGASLILMSHLGRPDGLVKPEFSLKPAADRLGELLGKDVKFVGDCVGAEVDAAAAALQPGEVLVLENLRFHVEETGKGVDAAGNKVAADADKVKAFRAALTKLADVYVNDAFGTAHRDHSSMTGVELPERACGYLLKKEIDFLGEALKAPEKPFVAVIGGAKISGKIDVIEALLPKVDKLIIGGAMANTFYKAQGKEIGTSLCEDERIEMAKDLLAKGGDKIQLPVDCGVVKEMDFGARTCSDITYVDAGAIPADQMAIDAGPKSVEIFSDIVKGAKTVVWNGPMGVFEIAESAKGTFGVAEALAAATANGAITIIGGGDSVSAIEKANLSDKVSHVSTGGGASLEYLEGKELPGVVALTEK